MLLFCSSRKACEMSAKHVAKFLPAHELMLRNTTSGPESAAIALEELQKCPAGLDPVLAETLPKGVAYHHAGLTVNAYAEWMLANILWLIYINGSSYG